MTRDAWRYRSPCCGSCDWKRRSTTGDFRCRKCGDSFDSLVDVKTGEQVSRETIA